MASTDCEKGIKGVYIMYTVCKDKYVYSTCKSWNSEILTKSNYKLCIDFSYKHHYLPEKQATSKLHTITAIQRLLSQTELVPLKLKRKLAYQGHYMYDYITPQKPVDGLNPCMLMLMNSGLKRLGWVGP